MYQKLGNGIIDDLKYCHMIINNLYRFYTNVSDLLESCECYYMIQYQLLHLQLV